MPPGRVIQHMIPSEGWWYVVPEKYGAGTHFADETIIYQVNPADGTVRQLFDTAPNYAAELACEHDGEFRGIRYDQKGIIVVTARP